MAGALDHRRLEQRGEAGTIGGGGHGKQAEFGAQVALQVQAEGECEVSVEAAFVHLVEDDAADAV